MKRNQNYEPSIYAVVIVVAILTLFVKGCDAYCKSHHEQWQKEMKERRERRIQESYYNCKFEHDY